MPATGVLRDTPGGWLSRAAATIRRSQSGTAPVDYTGPLIAYVAIVTLVAAGIFATTRNSIDDVTSLAVLSAAVFAISLSSVEPVPGLQMWGNASSLVNLGMAVTFGPVGCLLGALSEGIGVHIRARAGWFRVTFNVANFFLANFVAYSVFTRTADALGGGVWGLSIAGLVAGIAQFLLPNFLLAGVVAIATRSSYAPRLRAVLGGNWYTVFYGWGAALFPAIHKQFNWVGLTWALAPMVGAQALLVVFASRVKAHTAVRQQLLERIQQESARVERSYDATLVALTHALDARDRETEGHSRRVVEYTREIAALLGVKGNELTTLSHGALLHDIGKIGVPDAILHKPSELTEEEWEIMRRHPQLGAAIVEDIEVLKEARTIILHHHERWDGLGYPKGLRGNQIVLGARVFAVADAVDAITQDRPYRLALSLDRARVELQRNRGRQFDPDTVDAFLSIPEDRLVQIQRLRTPVNIDVLTSQAARNETYLAKSGLGVVNLKRRAS